MTAKQRTAALLIVLLALVSVLAGCGRGGVHVGGDFPLPDAPQAGGSTSDSTPGGIVVTDGSDREQAAEADKPAEPEVISLFGSKGKPKFTVIRPEDADPDTEACASILVKAINQKTGKKFSLKSDGASEADPEALELLVGATNRPESAESLRLFEESRTAEGADLSSNGGYLIVKIGNKICFQATDGKAMRAAAEDFSENWLGKGTVTVPAEGQSSGVGKPVEVLRLSASTRPALIETVRPTDEIVIADIVATDGAYGADPTGKKDSTSALKKALSACADLGGGTVWLPAGRYVLSSTVEIPAFVTLMGEAPAEIPATEEECGTIIEARVESGEETSDSLFVLRGSCGVVGLTVWYPEQSAVSPVPYPYTFYVTGNGQGGYMLQTVKDVVVVNGWVGIGACVTENNAHEQTTIENFRGTFLCHAVKSCNEADVGTWRGIRVSPDYWASSPFPHSPGREQIAGWTRKNADGLVLGDLEWDQFADITVEDCLVGVRTVEGTRVTFNGEMADLTVRRCGTGLLCEDMDSRWGMNLARSRFEDCETAIRNKTSGLIKLTDVTLSPADTEVSGMVRRAEGDLSPFAYDYARTHVLPAREAYTAPLDADNSVDVSADLQDALNEVGKTGGVLYLPAGIYRLEKPVTVPEGVELRGASSVATRGQSNWSKGTLISTSYGLGLGEDAPALITLSKNAGVSGIRFVYPKNGPSAAMTTPYVIRGAGSGVYCVNVAVAAAGSGLDFSGCDGHFVKKVTACCYDRGIRAGGKGGSVEGCLQNATVMMRQGLDFLEHWIPESQVFEKLFPILRSRSTFLTLDGAEGEQVLNYFAYGVMTVLEVKNSSDVLVVNLGGDNIGDMAPLVKTDGSGITIVNAQRYNGVLYECEDLSRFSFCNPLSIGDKREKNIILGEEHSFGGLE